MGQSPYTSTSAVASSVPFDNSTNGFISSDVQSAIEEVNAKVTTAVTVDQIVYVNKGGNDTTGNGSFGQPYLTIGKAITIVVDASPTKRYGVLIGPGDYNENLTIKANMFFIGLGGPIATRITGSTININDATWNVTSADNRSGFQDISVNAVATWDFSAQTNNTDGKLYFWNIRNSGAWTCTANSNITQIIIQDSEIFGSLTFNGCNTLIDGTSFQGSSVTVHSAATAGQGPAILTLSGGNVGGNITATWTSNGVVTANLYGTAVSSTTVLTASGTSCTVNAATNSIPVPANRSFTSGAILVRLNDNFASGLLSATTNVSVSSATAPSAGQVLIATNSTTAIWGAATTLTTQEVSATADTTTTSATDVLINSMTITPAAGTYLAMFSSTVDHSAQSVAVVASLYSGGVLKTDSVRGVVPRFNGIGANTLSPCVATQGLVTVNGSQAIEARWKTASGTATAHQRTLTILRVA